MLPFPQASSSRQLSPSSTGTLTWVVGPASSSGLSLNLQRRSTKHVLSGKVEVGVVSALSARVTYAVSETVSVRAQVSRFRVLCEACTFWELLCALGMCEILAKRKHFCMLCWRSLTCCTGEQRGRICGLAQ